MLESATYPGTARERILEESGLAAGRDFHLAFSPERVDPGRTDFTLRNTPKVLGGLTDACAERAEALYGLVCDQLVRVSTPEAAELTKLLENIFRPVNIALVNELAMLTDRIGIDIWEVLDAAATKPYGFMRFEPGPGIGGQCPPVDPFYLSWRPRELDMSLGVRDTRESPALKTLTLLQGLGAELRYHDPHVPALREHDLNSVSLDDALEDADLALILTAHPQVDHHLLAQHARLLIDLQRGHAHAGSRRGRAAVGGRHATRASDGYVAFASSRSLATTSWRCASWSVGRPSRRCDRLGAVLAQRLIRAQEAAAVAATSGQRSPL